MSCKVPRLTPYAQRARVRGRPAAGAVVDIVLEFKCEDEKLHGRRLQQPVFERARLAKLESGNHACW